MCALQGVWTLEAHIGFVLNAIDIILAVVTNAPVHPAPREQPSSWLHQSDRAAHGLPATPASPASPPPLPPPPPPPPAEDAPTIAISPAAAQPPSKGGGFSAEGSGRKQHLVIATLGTTHVDRQPVPEQKDQIQRAAIALRPDEVDLVVFSKSEEWRRTVLALGASGTSEFDEIEGLPLLRDLLRVAEQRRNHSSSSTKAGLPSRLPYHGFVNGDIALAPDAVPTLEMIEAAYQAGYFGPSRRGLVVIGHRLNVNGSQIAGYWRHRSQTRTSGACASASLFARMATAGVQQAEDAVDHVIIRDGSFDYNSWATWVVGTTSWDSFVVSHAIDSGAAVVDVSDTLHAFHLTGDDGAHAGRRPRPAKKANQRLWQDYLAERHSQDHISKPPRPHEPCKYIHCAQYFTGWKAPAAEPTGLAGQQVTMTISKLSRPLHTTRIATAPVMGAPFHWSPPPEARSGTDMGWMMWQATERAPVAAASTPSLNFALHGAGELMPNAPNAFDGPSSQSLSQVVQGQLQQICSGPRRPSGA